MFHYSTPKWYCVGPIMFETAKVGYKLKYQNSYYHDNDLAELDPESRLYFLGYGLKDNKIKRLYDTVQIRSIQKQLNGLCFCCLQNSQPNICEKCRLEFYKCKIKMH